MARTITGTVTSDKNDKTIVITVHTRKTHPLYRKQYSVSTKFMAHDEKNEAEVGDKVIITETRPHSARKRFALHQIVERGGERYSATSSAKVIGEPEPEPEAEEPKQEEAKE